ncbi:MAG: hypothetical protein JW388_1595 [Nitrospira sp.]|nr:hypothetical protein [Nitrospira sp.]
MKVKIKQHLVAKVPILGGKCFIYRRLRSGKVWQFQQWIKDEKKYIRLSLKTTDRQEATELAEKRFADALGRIHAGELIFSISAQEFCGRYLEYRLGQLNRGSIKKSYLFAIKSHLKHYLSFVGNDTKIHSIKGSKFEEYADYRLNQKPQPKRTSIKHSQGAISALYHWGFREQLLPQKLLPKFAELRIPASEGKREGMEHDDYQKIVTVSKVWDKKATSERDQYERKQVHNFIIIQSWTGMRSCEVLGLAWRDIKILSDGTAQITIREETTKRGKGRTCLSDRGDVFERVRGYSQHTGKNDHVFSSFLLATKWKSKPFYAKWQELISAVKAKYPTFDTTKSPYAFRHFYISSRLRAGDSPWLIAKHCGTSALMISRHYFHITDLQVGKKILSKKLKFIGDDVIGVTTKKHEDGDDER